MAFNLVHLSTLFLLLFAVNPFPIAKSRTFEPTERSFSKTLQSLEGVHRGQTVKGLSQLSNYLQKFGYLGNDHSTHHTTLTDHFDENLESALKNYQNYHHLSVTGSLDAATIERMSLPRCGFPDITITQHGHKRNRFGLVMVANYTFFEGSPKWRDSKRVLTYSFNSSADVILSVDDVRKALESAFQSWAKVTHFKFSETFGGGGDGPAPANIVIGFHRADHGDGYPFDGPGQVLAHAFAPEDGRMHYDADETWTTTGTPPTRADVVGFGRRRRRRIIKRLVIDLETVALHEIGHLLGLGHSDDLDSVMYPTYSGIKRDLKQDDINGIRALYGYN